MTRIEVVRTGLLTTLQDRGRPGYAHLGVPPSGAADDRAYELGNLLVGNVPGAAALEATLEGPTLRFDGPATVAVTGGATIAPHRVEQGGVLEVGRLRSGVRAYVCVRGGIDAEPTLGSRSTDLLTGLGPPPLRAGDVLGVGQDPPNPLGPATVLGRVLPAEPVLRVRLGPRADWFAPAAVEALCSEPWRVSSSSNRVGVRLEGPRLERSREGELLSEGLVTGAIQVPPSGQPILLLHDHPTTGGYPVIAVVRSDDLWLAGQLAPSMRVRFTTDG
jgi:biotin-dependent carboxylase-like uncharacterized protein